MNIYGSIKFQNKIQVKKRACLGKCEAWNNRFRIVIAKSAGQTFSIFAETMLHELLHLWVFILMALTNINLSERRQHKIIEKIMPTAIKEIEKCQED
jgi:hypothetical protein